MASLKLGPLLDEKAVRFTVELTAATFRDLRAYAELLSQSSGQAVEPVKLVGPMIAKFIATDRAFLRAQKTAPRVGRPRAQEALDEPNAGPRPEER